MDYVTQVNEALRTELTARELTVVYGQNVNAGSRLGGLARDFISVPGCRVINTPNTENSLVGMGFGLMLSGIPSMYVMKQQDFVLLGVDHLVNTWNALRARGPFVPFVMAMIVVDSGWEGPQSGFNNTSALASMSRIPAYFPTGEAEIPLAVAGAFQGGPALLAISQRLFRAMPDGSERNTSLMAEDSYTIRRIVADREGSRSILVLSSNFSLEQASAIQDAALRNGYSVTLVNFFRHTERADERLISLCSEADFLVAIDDAKSTLIPNNGICADIRHRLPRVQMESFSRMDVGDWAFPRQDNLSLDSDVVSDLVRSIPNMDRAGP